jgi:protoheme ferro-lyase
MVFISIVASIISIIAAFFTGLFLIKTFTAKSRYLVIHECTAIIMVIICVIFFLFVESGLTWLILVVEIAAFVGGDILMTAIVLRPPEEMPLPSVKRQPSDCGNRHVAVIYFTHGEPEQYSPEPWLHQFKEFDAQGIPFIPWIIRPLFLKALRHHYDVVGKSEHRVGHAKIVKALEASFRNAGDDTTAFYLSFLDDQPHPDAAAIQALNDGASAIIAAEVFVTTSNHTHEGEEMLRRLNLALYNVSLSFTAPLHDSSTLLAMFADKASTLAGTTSKEKVGILLVGHGQPPSWDREFPTETKQEEEFRAGITNTLVEAGFLPDNIRSAWMDFREPRVMAEARALAANGIDVLLYFPVAISADAMHSQYDIPEMIRKSSIPPAIATINGGAWNDHPLLVQAIKERIDAAIASLGR